MPAFTQALVTELRVRKTGTVPVARAAAPQTSWRWRVGWLRHDR